MADADPQATITPDPKVAARAATRPTVGIGASSNRQTSVDSRSRDPSPILRARRNNVRTLDCSPASSSAALASA